MLEHFTGAAANRKYVGPAQQAQGNCVAQRVPRLWAVTPGRWTNSVSEISVLALALVGCLLAPRAFAYEIKLEKQVLLLEASKDNMRTERAVPPGSAPLSLTFRVNLPAGTALPAEFVATAFTAMDGPQPHSLRSVLRGVKSGPTPKDSERLPVTLAPGWLDIELLLSAIRPRTGYTGRLYLFTEGAEHAWEITLKAGDLGTLAVDKLASFQVVTYHPYDLFASTGIGRQFRITLRDKSHLGPYSQLRIRVEDANQAKTTAIRSNFTLDALSFWADCAGQRHCTPLNLASGDGAAPQGSGTDADARAVNVVSQREIWARVESLAPGEYSPVLRFQADGASEQAEESKLALTLQVRHHWWLALLVIVLGSAAGWFGNKYVAGYRTTRTLRRLADELSITAALLKRPDPSSGGWRCPDEANSYALARVRVILHQAQRLTKNVFRVLAVEQDIRDRLEDAKRRLAALEALRTSRLKVKPVVTDRPAAQLAVGRAMRGALDILDRPVFGEPQKADFDALLRDIEAWISPERREARYREAVLERIQDLRDRVNPHSVPDLQVRNQLQRLLESLHSVPDLSQQTAGGLLPYDITAARLAILWRDRHKPWAGELADAQAADQALETLYDIADRGVWEHIRTAAQNGHIRIVVVTSEEARVKTYDLVEMRLAVQNSPLAESDLLRHPCQIRWRVSLPAGGPRLVTVTDGLTLVQYFRMPGRVTVEAAMEWRGDTITIGEPVEIEVLVNEEYRATAAFQWMEQAVTGLAALFAILSGLGTQYDATFGSTGQYIGLLIWAAGASAGGNLFKQLGTGRTVGGQEAQLPGR